MCDQLPFMNTIDQEEIVTEGHHCLHMHELGLKIFVDTFW